MSEARKPNARDTALEVLLSVQKSGAWSDGSLKRLMAKYRLDSREAALCTRLSYGVLQNRAYLDYYISAWCSQKAEKLEPLILNILRLGAYQILFADKIPSHAAVNEAVEETRRYGRPKAAGMVNAVLRKIAVNVNSLPPIAAEGIAEKLALQYSHPLWLVERLLSLLGEAETEAFLRLDNEAVPTTIQRNPLQITAEALEAELAASGAAVEKHPWLDGCYELRGTGELEKMPAFQRGHFMVQDAAARLAALAAAPEGTARVLDLCAAPGGKSFALAMAMGDGGEILSCDIHPHKLKLIESGQQRLGIVHLHTALSDGRIFRPEWQESADLVVADVPCSGLGIIRKKPEIRYKDPGEISGLPEIQRAILENAGRYVKPGGVLIYSTCTVLPEENEGVSGAFLSAHPEFSPEAFCLPGPIGECPGQVTLWPQRHGSDGFYISKMRKKKDDL